MFWNQKAKSSILARLSNPSLQEKPKSLRNPYASSGLWMFGFLGTPPVGSLNLAEQADFSLRDEPSTADLFAQSALGAELL